MSSGCFLLRGGGLGRCPKESGTQCRGVVGWAGSCEEAEGASGGEMSLMWFLTNPIKQGATRRMMQTKIRGPKRGARRENIEERHHKVAALSNLHLCKSVLSLYRAVTWVSTIPDSLIK